ncbi:hypothetical protein THAOC_12107, partial [Thalassiosira oceanica]
GRGSGSWAEDVDGLDVAWMRGWLRWLGGLDGLGALAGQSTCGDRDGGSGCDELGRGLGRLGDKGQ